MRLKLVLHSDGQEDRDLVATIDAATTVGDLASHLAGADPRRTSTEPGKAVGPVGTGGAAFPGKLTLALVDQGQRVVEARLTVPESGLRSGVAVAVTHHDETVGDVGPPVAMALIVAGPDAGSEFPLWRGTAYIGRGHGAEVRLTDSSVSRRHAKLVVAGLGSVGEVSPDGAVPAGDVAAVLPEPVAGVEVVDLGSANGISVGGVGVPRAILAASDRVRLGETEVEIALTGTAPDLTCHSATSADSTTVAFIRPPRIAPRSRVACSTCPTCPSGPSPRGCPGWPCCFRRSWAWASLRSRAAHTH